METIGFIGLGLMGSGMAKNLLKAGYAVRVYNRSPEKALPLIEAGATGAKSPAEAAQDADVIISMVGDDTASRTIWLGAVSGALAVAKPGATLIECSTLSVEWIRELNGLVKAKGLELIESPVAGSKVAAKDGALILYLGADSPAAVDKVMPILKTVSQTQIYFGPVGSGAIYKLINNMLVAVHIAALGEGLALAQRGGLNQETVVQTLLNGPTASPTVKGKMPSVVARNYDDVHFELRWMLKDINYALKLAESLNQQLPIVDAVKDVYFEAANHGLAGLDFAAVTEEPRKAA